MLAVRRGFTGEEKTRANNLILEKLKSLEEFKGAKNVFLYAASLEEVETCGIFEYAIKNGKSVFYPKVTGETTMEYVAVSALEALKPGYKGIFEPTENTYTTICPDLVIVPGVAFDKNFNRMGYGKGFYDRYLVEKCERVFKVGLCYDLQLLDTIPNDANDIKMDMLITEKEIWKRKKDN